MKRVEIFTDGACKGNPGKGGWAAILRYGSITKELGGYDLQTTNNRMELTAVIEGLKALNEPCEVNLTTDSKYVVDAINFGWLSQWEGRGWRTAGKKPVANVDLWEELTALVAVHNVHFHWVKGHDGHVENERCDSIARSLTI